MYDAIIVGARCGGSPAAMLLARKGYRVLLLDKSHFPSDIMSTHYVQPPGVARMQRWGILDRLRATTAPPITKVTVTFGEMTFSPPVPEGEAPPEAWCPRRIVLDKILVDAAVEAGAELREGFSVKELVFDGDRVAGVRGGANGSVVEERAKIVIGADGLHSLVAKAVQAPEYNTIPSLTYGYYAYWSGVPCTGAELYFADAGLLMFKTNDGCVCAGVGGPIEGFHEFRKDVEGNYERHMRSAGEPGERILAGKRESRYLGTADQPNYFRKPYGPGWALVGDAGYHRDFITGLGITDAFRDAELLANAIDDGFSGRKPLEDALGAYEAERNDIATPLYEFTTSLAKMEEPPSPELFMKFGAAMSRT